MAEQTHPESDGAARFREAMSTVGQLDPVASRERLLLRGGAGAMALGVVWVAVAYFVSHGTRNPLQQRDALVAAVFGMTVAIVGAAVYLRYSFGRFLRFWLARLSYEQQQREAVADAGRPRVRRASVRQPADASPAAATPSASTAAPAPDPSAAAPAP